MKSSPQAKSVLGKAISFGLVGVVNTLIDFGVFTFAYYVAGLPIIAANLISWALAVTCSYVLNSHFTFAAESGRQLGLRSYFTFVAAQVLGFIANTLTVFLCSYVMPVWAGKVLAIGASFVVNFSLSHFFVFRRR